MEKNAKYKMLRNAESKIRMGRSKRSDKLKSENSVAPYIYSGSTARTYMRIIGKYGDYLREKGFNKCTEEEMVEHAEEFIKSHDSVYTQYTVRSALAKGTNRTGSELCELPKRKASNVTRGRKLTPRAAAIQKNHPELVHICRSLGPRDQKEYVKLEAKNFYYKDGDLYCHIVGKGGRHRDSLVLPGKGKELIEDAIKNTPKGPLFRTYSGANVHRYRADYSVRMYEEAFKRGYSNGKIYAVRDGSGKKFDKGCMDYVSAMMGHGSGRYNTTYYSYMSYGENKE